MIGVTVSFMSEISISDPPLNRADILVRYSSDETTLNNVAKMLRIKKITPHNHPFAADVFAGDGSMAYLLNREGWNPSNITCIDRAISRRPLVDGVNWLYWDIYKLDEALHGSYQLPPEVEMYRGRFDLVMSLQSQCLDSGITVCSFLVKPGGQILTD